MDIKQKSDNDWMQERDRCARFFLRAIKERKRRATIRSITDANGDIKLGVNQVNDAFLGFCGDLQGVPSSAEHTINIFESLSLQNSLPRDQLFIMDQPISKEEI